MLVSPGGRERTSDEFAALLEASGLRLNRIVNAGAFSVVEAAPARNRGGHEGALSGASIVGDPAQAASHEHPVPNDGDSPTGIFGRGGRACRTVDMGGSGVTGDGCKGAPEHWAIWRGDRL